MITTTWVTGIIYVTCSWCFANLHNAHGWSFRVHPHNMGPYLVGESADAIRLRVSLSNLTNQPRQYEDFRIWIRTGELEIKIWEGDKPARCHQPPYLPRTNPKNWLQTQSQQTVHRELTLQDFSYIEPLAAGQYEIRSSLQTKEGKLHCTPATIRFIEPLESDILKTYSITLDEHYTNVPPAKKPRAILQHIKVENQVWLVYRRYNSPSNKLPDCTYRIALLPGTSELTVEGTYRAGNPITIEYRDEPYRKWTTKLVINSTNGRPWTPEEEKQRQEKLKRDGKLPEKK